MSGDVDGDSEGHKGPIALAGSGNPTSISVIIKNLIFQLWMHDRPFNVLDDMPSS
jgi:hypothetical protein